MKNAGIWPILPAYTRQNSAEGGKSKTNSTIFHTIVQQFAFVIFTLIIMSAIIVKRMKTRAILTPVSRKNQLACVLRFYMFLILLLVFCKDRLRCSRKRALQRVLFAYLRIP